MRSQSEYLSSSIASRVCCALGFWSGFLSEAILSLCCRLCICLTAYVCAFADSSWETFGHRKKGGWVEGRNHFVTNYRSQKMNDFSLELYLMLPLFLLLKNAPKKTLSTKMCPKAPQWPPKRVPNQYKTWFFPKVDHVCKQGSKKHERLICLSLF